MLSDNDPRTRKSKIANIVTPMNYQFDFKVNRKFSLGKIPFTAFMYIQNVFNRKNVQHVYWRTGSTADDGSFNIYPGMKKEFIENYGYPKEFFVLYDLINLQHRQHYQIEQGGDLFGRPREIRFGLQIEL